MSIQGVSGNNTQNYQSNGIKKNIPNQSTTKKDITSKQWGTKLPTASEAEGIFKFIVESMFTMSGKPTITLGDDYSPIVESYIDGKSSYERSLSDDKCTFTDYGYSCYLGEDDEPYMRYEDEKRLYEQCQADDSCFTQKHNEILGKLRHLPDGSTMFISDNHYDNGFNKGRALHIAKDFKTITIPINGMSWADIYGRLESFDSSQDYMNESIWQNILK